MSRRRRSTSSKRKSTLRNQKRVSEKARTRDDTAAPQESAVWTAACTALRMQREVRIERRPDTGPAPLTLTQANYWRGCPDPEAAVAEACYQVPIRGPLDVATLERAFATVLRLHHVLRSRILVGDDGDPLQVVSAEPHRSLEVIELNGADARGELERLSEEHAFRPMNLLEGPIYRAALVRLGDLEHVLLLAFNHLCWDGWSWPILVRDLRTAYEIELAGRGAGLPEPPIQIADLAHWQRYGAYRQVAKEQLVYWKEALEGLSASPRLVGGRCLDPQSLCPVRYFALPAGVIVGMRDFRSQTGASLFMIALACCKVLIWRYTGLTDVVVQTPMAYRMRTETRRLIGPCYNFVLLRTDLGGDPTFREVVARVGAGLHGAIRNQDVAFGDVLRALRPQDRDCACAVRVQLDWRTISVGRVALGKASFGDPEPSKREGVERSPTGKAVEIAMPPSLDLLVQFQESRTGLGLRIGHRRETFNLRAVNQFVQRYRLTMLKLLGAPDRRLSALVRR